MAKAMTTADDVCPPKPEGKKQGALAIHQHGTMNLPFMLAKNGLFWGSVALCLFGAYFVVSVL